MYPSKLLPLFALLLGGLAGGLGGCTAAGVFWGEHYDYVHSMRQVQRSWPDVDAIPHGARIRVVLTDGSSLVGRFDGVYTEPEASYKPAYEQARAALASRLALPGFGDTLTIVEQNGTHHQGSFSGFGVHSILLNSGTGSPITTLLLADVESMAGADEAAYPVRAIRERMEARALPLVIRFAVRADGRQIAVPLQQVQEVHNRRARTYYWLAGLGAGIALQALMGL